MFLIILKENQGGQDWWCMWHIGGRSDINMGSEWGNLKEKKTHLKAEPMWEDNLMDLNTLRTGSFKLLKCPFQGFLTILTL